MEKPTPDEVKEADEFITKVTERDRHIQRVLSIEDIDLERVKMAQYADPKLSEVITWINGDPPSKEEA